MSKIKILFYNTDTFGVNYYRTLKPATQLQLDFNTDFDIEINPNVDWNDFSYLKQFQIIHGHRTFCDFNHMPSLVETLRKLGIITILDIDDYWYVHSEHPLKETVKSEGLAEKIVNNLKLVDYVTTTTPNFANYIRQYNKNVIVLENGIDDSEKEFKLKEKEKSDFVRIGWAGGSSHKADLELLKDSFDILKNDVQLKNKYQLHVVGFDLRGTSTNITLSDEFVKDLLSFNIRIDMVLYKELEKNSFNVEKIKGLPQKIYEKYNKKEIIKREVREIKPTETVWYQYEKEIFTSNYKLIEDQKYIDFLLKFNLDETYPNQLKEQPYIRHKTKGVFTFANNYRNFDVALAPIKVFGKIKDNSFEDTISNRYQFAKSNLKVIEAGFHKIPVIASNIPTYNFDSEFVDGKNILFIKPERQYKDWASKIKNLILNPNKIADLGEAAYELVKRKYHISVITSKRAEFYKSLIK